MRILKMLALAAAAAFVIMYFANKQKAGISTGLQGDTSGGGSVIVLTDSNFEENVLQSKGIFLVDFYADWCPPCRKQSPVIEELARELSGGAAFGKLNVDASKVKAQEYSVRSIPTLMIFKDGRVKETLVGFHAKEILKEKIGKIK